jgi:hypothetical protein
LCKYTRNPSDIAKGSRITSYRGTRNTGVKVPEIPVITVARTLFPVTVAPDTCVVNTPETPVILLNCADVPVTVVPESVPVTVTPLANEASPVTVSPLTVRSVTLSDGVVIF